MAEKSPGAIYPDLDGKSVLVTGGGSGIGAGVALTAIVGLMIILTMWE